MTEISYPIEPYEQWTEEIGARRMFAGHNFRAHLFKFVRERAIARIPQDIGEGTKVVAKEAIDNALWMCMALLDGYFRTMIDENHRAVYGLTMHIEDEKGDIIEAIELTSLELGYAFWIEGDFGQEPNQ